MRQVREVLRLRWELKLGERATARSTGIGRTTVQDYVRRARVAGLSWPLPEGLSDGELEALLFPASPPKGTERPSPDLPKVHEELKRRGVTLWLLWEEYKAEHSDGYQYSRFAGLYRAWRGTIDPVMRQIHKAGEKLFVDYAGMTVNVVDRSTGEIRDAQIFVATSGASSYTFAEATWTQSLPDWIESHNHAMRFMGGVHEILVPDNLKAGVKRPCWYEAEVNRTYQELAEHYGAVIIPARVGKAKDKAKVESGVQGIEQRILAAVRDHTFFSLHEVNQVISERLPAYNDRPFQKMSGSRRSAFEELDKPVLKPLPDKPYKIAQWKKAKVHIDYHIEFDHHYYSVPYELLGKRVEVRATNVTVEILRNNERVTSHVRSYKRGRFTTKVEHMPKHHREYLEWSPERFIRWASKVGSATTAVIHGVLTSRPHPQQGYRTCLGILRLTTPYGDERLEAACTRALAFNALSYGSIASILEKGLDGRPLPDKGSSSLAIEHDNIRGGHYYEDADEPEERPIHGSSD
jgi:transposase